MPESFTQHCTQWNGKHLILGSKIWGIVPDEIKEKSSLSSFKESIEKMGNSEKLI